MFILVSISRNFKNIFKTTRIYFFIKCKSKIINKIIFFCVFSFFSKRYFFYILYIIFFIWYHLIKFRNYIYIYIYMQPIVKKILFFVIMLILLLIPMIVLLEKLKDKYKKEIKYENDKFSKYLFNNIKDSSMKQGLISTIVILSCFFLFGIVSFVLHLKDENLFR